MKFCRASGFAAARQLVFRGMFAMIIRNIKSGDIGAVTEIYNYYILNSTATFEEEPVSAADFGKRAERISAKYPFVVAEDGGRIIGYAYVCEFNERSAYRYTADLSIYTDKNSRHIGIGGSLLAEIEKRAAAQGIKSLISLVTGENLASVKFHENHGFKKCGTLNSVGFKFGRKLDVFYYQKEL